jgi:hypothetical protein
MYNTNVPIVVDVQKVVMRKKKQQQQDENF